MNRRSFLKSVGGALGLGVVDDVGIPKKLKPPRLWHFRWVENDVRKYFGYNARLTNYSDYSIVSDYYNETFHPLNTYKGKRGKLLRTVEHCRVKMYVYLPKQELKEYVRLMYIFSDDVAMSFNADKKELLINSKMEELLLESYLTGDEIREMLKCDLW